MLVQAKLPFVVLYPCDADQDFGGQDLETSS